MIENGWAFVRHGRRGETGTLRGETANVSDAKMRDVAFIDCLYRTDDIDCASEKSRPAARFHSWKKKSSSLIYHCLSPPASAPKRSLSFKREGNCYRLFADNYLSQLSQNAQTPMGHKTLERGASLSHRPEDVSLYFKRDSHLSYNQIIH